MSSTQPQYVPKENRAQKPAADPKQAPAPKQQQKQQQQKQQPQQSKKAKSASVEFPTTLKTVPYIDSHTHLFKIFQDLNCNSFEALSQQVELNQHAQYEGCINVNCWAEDWNTGLKLQLETRKDGNKNKIYSTYGLHPNESFKWQDDVTEKALRACLAEPDTVAVGECGLDYYRMTTPKEVQHKVFKKHLELAIEFNKPVVIHSREAEEDTLAILKDSLPKEWSIHLHCFTGTPEGAKALLANFPNLYIGFTGVITFPNSQTQFAAAVAAVGIKRILLETDGPYMAPVPYRGKAAHPAHIPYTALHLAQLLELSVEEVLHQTVANTKAVYRIQ